MREAISLCISAVEGSFPDGVGEVGGAVVETLPMGSFFTTASWRCRGRVENARDEMSAVLPMKDGVREINESKRRTLLGRAAPFKARRHCVQVYVALILTQGASRYAKTRRKSSSVGLSWYFGVGHLHWS